MTTTDLPPDPTGRDWALPHHLLVSRPHTPSPRVLPPVPAARAGVVSETVAVLHRLGAVLAYLDQAGADHATVVRVDEVRRLLVGDLGKPTHVAMPAVEAVWLRKLADAAEVVPAAFGDRDAAVHQLRQVLGARPRWKP